MRDQLTLEDAARDAAIERADAGAPPEWKDLALEAIERAARAQLLFTSDDVWATGLVKPREARALGAVFRRARALGLIEPTDRFRTSNVRVWRSLISEGAS